MKVSEVIEQAVAGKLRWIDAARIIGVSDRQMRRWRQRVEKEGPAGLRDKRLEKPPSNAKGLTMAQQVAALYKGQYDGFNVKHFHEKLGEEQGIKVSYTWTKALLQELGYVRRHPKRGTYRRRREREPARGMLVHLDGSKHRWFESEDGSHQDMLALVDDATTEILGACFVPEESTKTCLALIAQVVEKFGTFSRLYTDRASHFVYTPKAGEPPDRTKKTQVEKILDDLGIELVCAYSPQARGRSERLWRTLQGRLPQELRRAGAKTYDEANLHLVKFVAQYNRTLAVAPETEQSAFLPVTGFNLNELFSLRFERVVNNDGTIRLKNQILQLPKVAGWASLAKRKVTLRVSLEGQVRVLLGQRLVHVFEQLIDLNEEPGLEAA